MDHPGGQRLLRRRRRRPVLHADQRDHGDRRLSRTAPGTPPPARGTLTAIAADDAVADDTLVSRARAGDRDALEALLRRHYDRIYALCRRMTGNDADAADAAQEALIALVRGLPRFDGRAAFTTWAYRVATNACLDEMRRRQRRPDPTEAGTDGELPRRGGEPGLADSVSDRLDIDRALGRLPLDFRTVVVLRDQLGMDYAAIAEALDIPIGTVRSRLARGRAALADALGNPRARPAVQEHSP